jgi:hypothetical protein
MTSIGILVLKMGSGIEDCFFFFGVIIYCHQKMKKPSNLNFFVIIHNSILLISLPLVDNSIDNLSHLHVT